MYSQIKRSQMDLLNRLRRFMAAAAAAIAMMMLPAVPLHASHEGVTIPEAPDNVMASYDEYHKYVRITWDEAEGATHYRILRQVGDSWVEIAGEEKVHGDFDFGLYWDKPYIDETLYGIQACNSAGCSDIESYDCGSSMPEML